MYVFTDSDLQFYFLFRLFTKRHTEMCIVKCLSAKPCCIISNNLERLLMWRDFSTTAKKNRCIGFDEKSRKNKSSVLQRNSIQIRRLLLLMNDLMFRIVYI